MLDKPILSKKGTFSIEKIENISNNTTKVTLRFYKRPRGSMYLGHYKKVEHYSVYDNKTHTKTHHDDRWSVDGGDIVTLYIPKLNETIYKLPFGNMLNNKVIKLNEVSNPAYVLELKVPVSLTYAKKFKSLLLAKDFKPTAELVMSDGELKGVGIAEIKDPEMLVVENAYKKAQGNITRLEVFLEKYGDSTFANKAQNALQRLKKEKVLLAEQKATRAREQKQQKQKAAKDEYEAYHKAKIVGDKVCMEGKMLLFMTVKISGYVEDVKNNKIKIRIADTESQSPKYNGVTLKQGAIIWDEQYNWKGCQ